MSVHKGTATLVAHALLTARRHGILDAVLAELETGDLLLGTDPA